MNVSKDMTGQAMNCSHTARVANKVLPKAMLNDALTRTLGSLKAFLDSSLHLRVLLLRLLLLLLASGCKTTSSTLPVDSAGDGIGCGTWLGDWTEGRDPSYQVLGRMRGRTGGAGVVDASIRDLVDDLDRMVPCEVIVPGMVLASRDEFEGNRNLSRLKGGLEAGRGLLEYSEERPRNEDRLMRRLNLDWCEGAEE